MRGQGMVGIRYHMVKNQLAVVGWGYPLQNHLPLKLIVQQNKESE